MTLQELIPIRLNICLSLTNKVRLVFYFYSFSMSVKNNYIRYQLALCLDESCLIFKTFYVNIRNGSPYPNIHIIYILNEVICNEKLFPSLYYLSY